MILKPTFSELYGMFKNAAKIMSHFLSIAKYGGIKRIWLSAWKVQDERENQHYPGTYLWGLSEHDLQGLRSMNSSIKIDANES